MRSKYGTSLKDIDLTLLKYYPFVIISNTIIYFSLPQKTKLRVVAMHKKMFI